MSRFLSQAGRFKRAVVTSNVERVMMSEVDMVNIVIQLREQHLASMSKPEAFASTIAGAELVVQAHDGFSSRPRRE